MKCFPHLSSNYVSSLVNSVSCPLPIWKYFSLLLSFWSRLFWMLTPIRYMFFKYFPPFLRLPLHSFDCVLWCTEGFNFDKVQFIFLSLSPVLLVSWRESSTQASGVAFSSTFSSLRFVVFGLTFRSLIHFEFLFVCGMKIRVQLHSRACGHQHCLLEMPSGRKATGPERGTERGQKESVGGRTEVQSVGERRTRRGLRGSKSAAHHPPREKVAETSSGWRQNCLLSCWARVQSQTPGYRRQFWSYRGHFLLG